MERAERLHECQLGMWLLLGNIVCGDQPPWSTVWLYHGSQQTEGAYRLWNALWNYYYSGKTD